MDFGLALHNYGPGVSPATLDASAEVAEELGWRTVYTVDHLVVPRSGEPEYHESLDPILSLAHIGARHSKLRLATGVVVPAMRNAVLLAKELATLDLLSDGRLIAGVGVGDEHDLGEYTNLGQQDRFRVRGAYLDETIALWRHLWSGNTEAFQGRFHVLSDFSFEPLPAQGGRLPIWSGGRSERAMDRVARLCDGFYSSRWGPEDLRAFWPTVVERARAYARPRPTLATRVRVRIDQPADDRYSLCGSPAAMAAQLIEFDEVGTDEFVAVLPAIAPDDVRREARRFESEVIDRYRDDLAARRERQRDEYSM